MKNRYTHILDVNTGGGVLCKRADKKKWIRVTSRDDQATCPDCKHEASKAAAP